MLKHQGGSRAARDEQAPMSSAPARGQIRGMNRQTPRRRLILFRGVCRFRYISVNFRAFCLEVMRFFVYLQQDGLG